MTRRTYSVYDFKVTKEHDNCIDEVWLKEIFHGFHDIEELEKFCWRLEDGEYLIIAKEGEKPVEASGVVFKSEDGTFIDGAEWDFRVIASVGFGVDLM